MVITNSKYEQALINYHKKIADASVEDMVLNMGPQHPSTHGVLRLELITDGEIVKEVIPHIGYLHRCFEKHAESLTYQQTIPFTDRMDYLASMNNSHAFVMGVERMMGIDKDIPKRVEYIRVLVCEFNRRLRAWSRASLNGKNSSLPFATIPLPSQSSIVVQPLPL